MTLWHQEWGQGRPVIALHPLALESTVFLDWVGARAPRDEDDRRRSSAPGARSDRRGALRRSFGAILELPRRLDEAVVLGMSGGGRVAALIARALRGVVLVAPCLPPLRRRWTEAWRASRSELAGKIQSTRGLLQRVAARSAGLVRGRRFMRARARVAYYLSCPATRAHFVAAARDMALDPAFGPTGTWTRLAQLALPASFVWGDRDWLIPRGHAAAVAELLPRAQHLRVPCSGHFMHGKHHRCFERAMADAVGGVLSEAPRARPRRRATAASSFTIARCFVDAETVRATRTPRSVPH
jgi:pimeloyl-ACP methyl ester carboxylesterase